MRYPASEKLEIIRLVEQSHLPVRRTLEKLGVSRATFYRWCDLYQTGGPEALEDRSSRPDRVWNRIPDTVRGQIVQLALDEPELSPRELATRFTDTKIYFVSEASVYRLLKEHDLIASPAYIVMKAADEFKDKTTTPNQLWQTDFTYLSDRLGLVLPQHDIGRLFALHHRLEALHDDEGRGRHGNAGPGAASLRA
jgi:putative transposase